PGVLVALAVGVGSLSGTLVALAVAVGSLSGALVALAVGVGSLSGTPVALVVGVGSLPGTLAALVVGVGSLPSFSASGVAANAVNGIWISRIATIKIQIILFFAPIIFFIFSLLRYILYPFPHTPAPAVRRKSILLAFAARILFPTA
ncbi:MAG: hypothetical protein RSG57_06370, partial [Christensenellaceae bacterium]